MTTVTSRAPVMPEVPARPPSRVATIVVSLVAGVALAVVWSAQLVDREIGMTVANSVLGTDARNTAIAGSVAGVVFAFVSGFAGTFTACNVAVFGALPAVTARSHERRARLRGIASALGWLSVGLLAVAVVYGFVSVLLGSALPQLSTARVGNDVPVRLLQSIVVFGVIGIAFLYLGLASLSVVPDPFAGRPRARLFTLGALIGGFLVGRPYPLFQKLACLGAAGTRQHPADGRARRIVQPVRRQSAGALAVRAAPGRGPGRWRAVAVGRVHGRVLGRAAAGALRLRLVPDDAMERVTGSQGAHS